MVLCAIGAATADGDRRPSSGINPAPNANTIMMLLVSGRIGKENEMRGKVMDDLTVQMTLTVNAWNATSLAALNAALNANKELLEYGSKDALNAIAVCLEGLKGARAVNESDLELLSRIEQHIQELKDFANIPSREIARH